jgi:hypothetical protein
MKAGRKRIRALPLQYLGDLTAQARSPSARAGVDVSTKDALRNLSSDGHRRTRASARAHFVRILQKRKRQWFSPLALTVCEEHASSTATEAWLW